MYSDRHAPQARLARLRVVPVPGRLLRRLAPAPDPQVAPERKGGPRDKVGKGGAVVRHGANPSRRRSHGAEPRRPRRRRVSRETALPRTAVAARAQKPSPTARRGAHTARPGYTVTEGASGTPEPWTRTPPRRPRGGPTRAPRVPPPAPPAGRGPSHAPARALRPGWPQGHSGTAADPAQRSGHWLCHALAGGCLDHRGATRRDTPLFSPMTSVAFHVPTHVSLGRRQACGGLGCRVWRLGGMS